MTRLQVGITSERVELLMEMAMALADFTQSAELCGRIPEYLSAALDIGPVTLGVVRRELEGEMKVIFRATSLAAVGKDEGVFHQNLIEAHGAAEETGVGEFGECGVEGGNVVMKEFVVSRKMDENTWMVLMARGGEKDGLERMQEEPGGRGLTDEVQEALVMVAGRLSKLMTRMMLWQDQPELLGEPFEQLTQREWMVLQALNSSDGEKQLADRLSLSPHTLHSHIKAIYRKVGVQGRLPLLLKLQEAMRSMRMASAGLGAEHASCA